MVKRVLPLFCMLAIALLLSATVIVAQAPTGTMTGTVLDQQGAAIVGASVEVKDSTTGAVVYTGTSGADGHFQVGNLAPGVYTVTVTEPNFKKAVYNNIDIDAGKTYDVAAKLEIGQVIDTVTVEAGGAQVIETQNTSVNTTVSGKAITNLPFNSRSGVLLGVLDPGAQTAGGSRNSTFEGLPKGAINITFDGINIQDNVLKSNDGFFAINDPRIDDVDEFNITSAANSVDKAGEGAVQIAYVSKRGGNAWHGGVWEYFRNTDLDANYYFNKEANQPRQILQLNEYGYKIGGPIFKDKLFFFTDFDFFNLPQSVSRSRTVLTPLAASGTFSYFPVNAAGNTCTPGAAGCVAAGSTGNASGTWETCSASTGLCQLNLLTLASANSTVCPATAPCKSTLDQTVASVLSTVDSTVSAPGVTIATSQPTPWQTVVNYNAKGIGYRKYPDLRLDYNLSQHHSLEFDYHYAHYISTPDILNNVDATYPVGQFATNQGAQVSNRNLFALAWRWAIGSSASNELRAGAQIAPVDFGIGINDSFYPVVNTSLGPVTTRFTVTGLSNTPFFNEGNTQGRNAALGQILDNFTWTKGSHNLAFGFAETTLHYNDFFDESSLLTFGIDTTNDPANGLFSASNVPGISNTDLSSARGLYASLTARVSAFSNAIAFDPNSRNFKIGSPIIDKLGQLELGAYATDTWRMRPTFSLTYGVRWQYDGPPQDKLNEYFTVQGGYAGVFGISGQGNLFKPGTIAGQTVTYVNDAGTQWWNKYWKAFAPNVGFAWQPNWDNRMFKSIFGGAGKTVVRAAYSIAYDREGLNNFLSIAGANPGYTGNQSDNSSSVALSSTPGNFSAGTVFLGNTIPNVLQNPSNFVSSFALNPSASNTSANAFNPNLRPGMVQSWTLGIQRELGANQVLEVRYVGNHGTGLWRQYNLNETNIFENGFLSEFNAAANNLKICQANASACTTAQGAAGLAAASQTPNNFGDFGLAGQTQLPIFTASFNGTQAAPSLTGCPTATTGQCQSNFRSSTFVSGTAGDLPLGIAGAAANTLNSLSGWTNLVKAGFATNFWVVNPETRFGATSNGAFVMDNATQSTYNALIVDFRRRQAKGLYFDLNYAFSKSLTNYYANSSVDAANFTTLRNRGYDKGPAPFDIHHAVKGQLLYELPFGEGKRWAFHNGLANRIIGGWNINSIVRWQTGPPILINSGVGGTFNAGDPGINLIGLTNGQLQSLLTTNKTEQAGTVFYVPTSLLDAQLKKANVAVLQPCNVGGALCSKVFVWGPQFFRADISLVKVTKITERVSLELRGEALDAFNNQDFYWACGAGTNPCTINTQSTRFGQMGSTSSNGAYQDFNTTQDPGGRVLQLVARVNF